MNAATAAQIAAYAGQPAQVAEPVECGEFACEQIGSCSCSDLLPGPTPIPSPGPPPAPRPRPIRGEAPDHMTAEERADLERCAPPLDPMDDAEFVALCDRLDEIELQRLGLLQAA